MTKNSLMAPVIAAAAFGAILMSAGAVSAATPGPTPSLVRSDAPAVQVRMMKRSMMQRPMARRGGGRTISTKLGAKRG